MALILASGSSIRHQILSQAGIAHEVVPAGIDESAIKVGIDKSSAIALELAKAKALDVSKERPGDWVIGSDSVVSVGGLRFDKPADRAQAAEHLRFFSDKAMTLTSAVSLVRDGAVDWAVVDEALLQVRPLSEEFIATYLDAEWPEVGACVGVFRLEGRGAQLFELMDGSYFTILGMPLLPLLNALRQRGLAPS